MDFSRSFVLPVSPLLQRPFERHRSGTRAVIHTTAAVPALFRMEYDGRSPFLGMGYVDVHRADFYAMIAAVADIRVEGHRAARRSDIWHGDYLFFWHLSLQDRPFGP